MTVDRFECVVDACDSWMVWDTCCEVPAEFAGRALVGLHRDEALVLCRSLNRSPISLLPALGATSPGLRPEPGNS